MRIKPEIRILGVDDASFSKGDTTALVVGVVYRGPFWLDGLVSTHICIDGLDATEKLIDMITSSKYEDLRIIMLSGLTFGGFNVVDIATLSNDTQLPVIVVIDRMPNFEKIQNALTHVSEGEYRMEMMKKAGKIYPVGNETYFQAYGIDVDTARKLIQMTSIHSLIPEPLRISHIIATGISNGQATKR